MIYKIFSYKKVNSTNDIAIKKIKKGFSRGLVQAEIQKKGRGQHGKKWISYNGNLFITIFFKINKKISLKKITFKNCSKIKKVISILIKKNLTIKRPNDLLLNKKKICGILQETIAYNNNLFLVLGIGINLIRNPKIINYPTTNILDEVRINVSKKLIIKHIINEFKYN
jgi:BirA family biotin operon repressor/biotin-[acetyl-CoA-carboxylase] ligase